jgi:hypothetical protein
VEERWFASGDIAIRNEAELPRQLMEYPQNLAFMGFVQSAKKSEIHTSVIILRKDNVA